MNYLGNIKQLPTKLYPNPLSKSTKLVSLFAAIIIVFSNIFLTGCTNKTSLNDPITVTAYKLNTIVSISSYVNVSKDVLENGMSLCDKYEAMYSRTMESSLLNQVNNQTLKVIPEELAKLIQYGLDYSLLSNGAFDITIGSVSSLWDFNADNPVVPDKKEIDEALKYVDYTKVELSPIEGSTDYRINIPKGTVLDLGAIAKGYIADRIKDFLLQNDVTSAIINLGGNVLCVGSKANGSDFKVGVKKPFTQTNESIATLQLNDMSAVSSGTYERYFYSEDKFYHHILDPHTGFPYETELNEVTIISKLSIDGDCLSTTCFVLGLENGLELINGLNEVEAVFVTKDGNIHYSDGISKYLIK